MSYDPHLNVMQKTIIEATDNIRRDFVELQFLQRSNSQSSKQFSKKTYNKVKDRILQKLEKARPDYGIIVENNVAKAAKNDDNKNNVNDSFWIVFPLEGFENFGHATAHFASIIAFAKKNIIETATVYQPLEGNIYTVKKQNGAMMNGARITVSNHKNIHKSLVLYNKAQNQNQTIENKLLFDIITTISKQNIEIRSYGARILDMLAIATASAQIYIDNNQNNILSNIGKLFVEEARGKTSRFYFQNQKTSLLLATNNNLHETTEKILEKIAI